MLWTIIATKQAEEWLLGLPSNQFAAIAAAIDLLEKDGPTLGRPAVDTIRGSKHANMKELRSFGGYLRALFAFDPKRRAIVLLGGDKNNNWQNWYNTAIPKADELYDQHLENLKKE